MGALPIVQDIKNIQTKLGTIALTTTAQKVIDAINEINAKPIVVDANSITDAQLVSTGIKQTVAGNTTTIAGNTNIISLKGTLVEQRKKETIISRHNRLWSLAHSKVAQIGLTIGDSIAQGTGATSTPTAWGSLTGVGLQTKFATPTDWIPINVGVGGTNVSNLLNQISYDITIDARNFISKKSFAYGYPYWIIMTGRNDCSQLSLADFEYYYKLIVKMARMNGIDVICCTEPARINITTGAIVDGIDNTYPDYAEVIRQIASSEGCSLLDLYKEWLYMASIDGTDLRTLSTDGTHPNDAGHQIIANKMIDLISTTPSAQSIAKVDLYSDYRLIPQLSINAPTSGVFTLDDISAQAQTAYWKRTGNDKAYHITSGNYAQWEIPKLKADYIFVNVVATISLGSLTVQCPGGYTLATIVPSTANTVERTYIYKTNITTIGKSYIKLIAVSGDVYVTGIGIIAPCCNVVHNGINGIKTGTWLPATYEGATYFTQSATTGDKIDFEWYGTNIVINFGQFTDFGNFSISTDGGTVATADGYRSIGYVFGGGFWNNDDILPLGWHKTTLTVLGTKNASSTGYKVGIGKIYIYDIAHTDGSIIAKVGTNISVNLNTKYNYIRSSVSYTVATNVLTTTTDGVIETTVI